MSNTRNRARPTEKPVEAMKDDTSLRRKVRKKVPACGIVGGLTAITAQASMPTIRKWLIG